MDVVREALRIFFIVGIVAIPLLYWLSGRVAGRNKNRAQNERERRSSEERNLSRSA